MEVFDLRIKRSALSVASARNTSLIVVSVRAVQDFSSELFGGNEKIAYLCSGETKIEAIMETRKFKQVPSLNRISGHNPLIPRPVVVNCGSKKIKHERTITRPMRTNSRPIGVGEPINWDEVYD